jgi:uncharacterized GH25 family protein
MDSMAINCTPLRKLLVFAAIVLLAQGYMFLNGHSSLAIGQELTKKTGGTMLVRVVGPDGGAIKGVKIHKSVWTKEPGKHNADYISDDKGEVAVDLPKTLSILRLWARKDGFVPLFAHWEQFENESIPKEFTFKLTKGATIGGFVKGEDGQPITGARVAVELDTSDDVGDQMKQISFARSLAEEEDSVVSDASGRWALDNVPPGDGVIVKLSITHPDYISDMSWGGIQDVQGITPAMLREQKAAIVLHRGTALTGTVTDPNGKPVNKAVVVWGDDPYATTGMHQEHRQETYTDENGVYRLPPLPPLKLTLTVIAQGCAPDLKKVSIAPENPKVDFQLKPGNLLRIKFVDDKGRPIPGVHVGIAGWRGSKSLYNTRHPIVLDTKIPETANKDGIYEWTWAPQDEVLYDFSKEGYEFVEAKGITADGSEHEVRMSKASGAQAYGAYTIRGGSI